MKFKVVKLTKRLLNLNPEALLIELGAYSKELNQSFPEYVYMDRKDYDNYYKRLTKKLKGPMHYEMLMYGPSTANQKITISGHIVIDEESLAIKKNMEWVLS